MPAVFVGAAIGLALSTTATWVLRTISTRVQRTFRDKLGPMLGALYDERIFHTID